MIGLVNREAMELREIGRFEAMVQDLDYQGQRQAKRSPHPGTPEPMGPGLHEMGSLKRLQDQTIWPRIGF
jgi:hypothetical protein